MSHAWFRFGDAILVADPSGALIWPARSLLVVADLHFEKGSFWARHGALLPPYDTRATLSRLGEVLARWSPHRVVSLGDGFHDPEALLRMNRDDRDLLATFTRRHAWIWLSGNHDPSQPAGLAGAAADRLEIAGVLFQHEPGLPAPALEIAGHLHPAASILTRGRRVMRPCFVADQRRIVLPSFGSYTGGLDLRADALTALFPDDYRAYLLGPRRVHVIARRSIDRAID